MTEKVVVLEDELKYVRIKLDDADQYMRKNSIILSGPAVPL